MKKIISFILLLCISPISFAASGDVVSDSCSYKSEFEQCKEQNKNGNPRSIEDFVCISSNNDVEILTQIILDKQFKKYDKELDTYLKQLEDNKTKYFWKSASSNFLEAIDEIESKLWFYQDDSLGKKYYDSCQPWEKNSVVAQAIDCLWGSVGSLHIEDYFQESTCKKLALTKLEINKQVAYDVLKLNKNQVKKDERKLYVQEERSKYDKLLEIIMVNIGYMERIWKKWPSKSKDAK